MSRKDIGKIKKCEVCGKAFVVNSPTQKYCSIECRLNLQNELQRVYNGISDKPKVKRSPKGTRKNKKKVYKNVCIMSMH